MNANLCFEIKSQKNIVIIKTKTFGNGSKKFYVKINIVLQNLFFHFQI